jgi:outer membrane protein assembly factor BamB
VTAGKRLVRRTQHLVVGLATLAALTPVVARASPADTTHLAGIDRPSAIAAAAGKLWIANAGNDSVLVTSLAGQRLQTLHGAHFGFAHPDAIAVADARVFVLSRAGAITELNASDGSLVRVIRGHRYSLRAPTALLVHGGSIWVADSSANAVTEISAVDGSLVRVVRSGAGRGRITDPVALAIAGQSLWVVSRAGWISRLSLASGAVVQRVGAAADGLSSPAGVAFDGTHLWVASSATNTVAELTSTGRLVRVIANDSGNSNYGFDAPSEVMAHGGYVYVLSPASSSPMVTKVNRHNAKGLWFECNTNSPNPRFANPAGFTIVGRHIWVVSPGPAIAGNGALADSVAELHLGSGQQIATYH